MEKRRLSVENDTLKLKMLDTLKRLGFKGGTVDLHRAFLGVNIKLDLSGEEWDDDFHGCPDPPLTGDDDWNDDWEV